ncbi:MAG: copper resistance D family protein, partial [Acidimicrobiales bacterium]
AEDDVGLAALVTAAGLAVLAWRPRASWSWIAGAAAVAGFALTGHPRASSPVAVTVVANAVHLLAAGLWIGGLIVVFLSFRQRSPDVVARIVERFSWIAFFTFSAAAVVGVVLAWAEVRALRALTSTTYGWILIAKVVVVAAVGAIALYNRHRLVPRIADSQSRRILARTISVEIIGFLVIIALTTMLVNITPARSEAGVDELFADRLELTDDVDVEMVVDPNQAGALNEIHLYFTDPTGRPVELTEVEVAMALPARNIEPIRRAPFRAGPGHMLMSGRELTIPGDWEITITTQLDQFTQAGATFDVPVS